LIVRECVSSDTLALLGIVEVSDWQQSAPMLNPGQEQFSNRT
jgi:hypothetical protein